MLRALFLILFCCLANPAFAGYSYVRSIQVQSSQISGGPLTQFPILVCGNGASPCNAGISGLNQSGGGAHVQNSSGYDIIFTTDSACTNKLTWEMEKYVAITGEFEVWVANTSTPLPSAGTTFYLCYGNAAISSFQSTASSVWDSNYKAVWHFPNGTSLNTNDSTSNGNNATNNATVATAVAAQIDGGANMNPNTGGVSAAAINTSNVTIETWINFTGSGCTSTCAFMVQNLNQGFEFLNNTNTNQLDLVGNGFANFIVKSTPSTNTWHHIAGTINGTSGVLYVDGVGTSGTISAVGAISGNFLINYGSGFPVVGYMDEARVSNIARSAGWIATEYNNQSAPSSFYIMGSETQVGLHQNIIQGTSTIQGLSTIN